MKQRLLLIYDLLTTRRRTLWAMVAGVCVVLAVLAATLRYNEDIMDFLPATPEEREAFRNYQAQQTVSQLVLIIDGEQADEALYEMESRLADCGYTLSTDPSEQLQQLYGQLPYLIADSTYARFDSLFTPQAIRRALERDKRILATPGGSMLAPAIQADPLGLVELSTLSNQQSASRAYGFLPSPYGGTESGRNAALIDSLEHIASEVTAAMPQRYIRWVGAPVISVGNARRIKTDTLLCIALSLVLITALLAYAFPRRRDLWLIILAVSFGWLTAMAVLRLVTPAVSAVVLGIGSVLIGIAVNYPLHLLVHQRYTSSVRQTLDEVLSPLVTGNITTVGAFLALIPLQATAMRHLGIFAAAMLVGTILFCIFIMPHLMSAEPTPIREIKIRNEKFRIKDYKYIQWGVVVITVIFGIYLLLSTIGINSRPMREGWGGSAFDFRLSTINYMTPEQRADMAALDAKRGDPGRWTDYWQSHDANELILSIREQAQAAGFKPEAFEPFYELLRSWQPVEPVNLSDLTKRLSDDFDYIGLCCSVIVFVFLWLSFRNLWLALIAFVPMALSWVWILALMQLFGLQFNIVNIILATFIFGQGDDYTIFIVEGLLYEHRTGRPILPQYRQSILLSALIMLIGIGILAFAVHPAMHSLGVITLLGMSVVLLMALTVPPLLFRLYTRIIDRA